MRCSQLKKVNFDDDINSSHSLALYRMSYLLKVQESAHMHMPQSEIFSINIYEFQALELS